MLGLGGTSDPFAVDLVAPTATITAIDASTGTSGVDISGTVSAAPAIGEFVPFPGRARDLLRLSWSGWRDVGIGSDAAPPRRWRAKGSISS